MRQELMSLEGVVEAEVSFDDQRAEISYRPEQVTPGQLEDAVDRTGFEATLQPTEDEAPGGGRSSPGGPDDRVSDAGMPDAGKSAPGMSAVGTSGAEG